MDLFFSKLLYIEYMLMDGRNYSNDKATVNIFKDVLNTYMPLEQKWLIRIILKGIYKGR